MPDRGKVMDALRHCIFPHEGVVINPCDGCPYKGSYDCTDRMKSDCLKLLKKQEAKQVVLHVDDEWYGPVLECPDCKAEWMSDKVDTHYCPHCGRTVKWDA